MTLMEIFASPLLTASLLGLFVVGYLVLAGSDVGLGMLMPYVTRTPEQRRQVVAAIAPYFLASEVWLVAAVGVMAGMVPDVEHVVIATLWPVLVLLLAAWLLRDAGLWFRARVDSSGWRSACDTAIVAGSWLLATSWGVALAGLLAGELTLSPFTVVCTAAVVSLFALRGAAFGAERLVGATEAESADVAARATRALARVALATVLLTVAVAVGLGVLPAVRVEAAVLLTAVAVAALAATTGPTGPMLSRHTSAVAIAVPGLIVALSVDLSVAQLPGMTGVFVWSMLLPTVPVMLLGQVWLYRMTRRPAAEPTFFA
ncbi:Cytochrome d ubiquinol oxidase subunit II [Nocardiopsis sp. JB363]|nr:Cytochrome d ubiquinol oxidase subunit II [Nocardiopsis sp. JB363]